MSKIGKIFLLAIFLWGVFLVYERKTGRLEKSLRMKHHERVHDLVDETLGMVPIYDPAGMR